MVAARQARQKAALTVGAIEQAHARLRQLSLKSQAQSAETGRVVQQRMARRKQLESELGAVQADPRASTGEYGLEQRCKRAGDSTRQALAALAEVRGQIEEIEGAMPERRLSAADAKALRDALAAADRRQEQLGGVRDRARRVLGEAEEEVLSWTTELHERIWSPGDQREREAIEQHFELHAALSPFVNLADGLAQMLSTQRRALDAGSDRAAATSPDLERLAALLAKLEHRPAPGPLLPSGSRTVVMRELTPAEEEEVDDALGPGDASELLADFGNIPVDRAKMRCLHSGSWLNDEVINIYMKLLGARNDREGSTLPDCHFHNTMFYAKLAESDKGYCYANVRRWTKRVDLFSKEMVIVPTHVDGIHWTLSVINFKLRRFECAAHPALVATAGWRPAPIHNCCRAVTSVGTSTPSVAGPAACSSTCAST